MPIGELFQLLAEQTKEIEKEVVIDSEGFIHHTIKLDGTMYYFSTVDKNGEVKTGETYAPSKNTLLRKLTVICNNLYSIGKGEGEISQTDVSKEIDKLINDLK